MPNNDDIVSNIRRSLVKAIESHFDVLRKFVDLEDPDLRMILTRLTDRLKSSTDEARANSRVTLELDNLFVEVTRLILEAKAIDAIDIEVNRWEEDNRAKDYLNANFQALQNGAIIRRVYIISPHITVSEFNRLLLTIKDHVELNHDPDGKVIEKKGEIEVKAIYHEDVPCAYRHKDFAIFDKKKVLFEAFDNQWRSKHTGDFTIDKRQVAIYQNAFNKIWEKGELIGFPLSDKAKRWAETVKAQIQAFKKDIFLGYCSTPLATEYAAEVKRLFEKCGYGVTDWAFDFAPAAGILEEIEKANRECAAGVFLFTEDDRLITKKGDMSVPRDNVVFEAGFFMGTRGKERTLIIRQGEAKMPSDLGGIIYLKINRGERVSSIATSLEKWLERYLGAPLSGNGVKMAKKRAGKKT